MKWKNVPDDCQPKSEFHYTLQANERVLILKKFQLDHAQYPSYGLKRPEQVSQSGFKLPADFSELYFK